MATKKNKGKAISDAEAELNAVKAKSSAAKAKSSAATPEPASMTSGSPLSLTQKLLSQKERVESAREVVRNGGNWNAVKAAEADVASVLEEGARYDFTANKLKTPLSEEEQVITRAWVEGRATNRAPGRFESVPPPEGFQRLDPNNFFDNEILKKISEEQQRALSAAEEVRGGQWSESRRGRVGSYSSTNYINSKMEPDEFHRRNMSNFYYFKGKEGIYGFPLYGSQILEASSLGTEGSLGNSPVNSVGIPVAPVKFTSEGELLSFGAHLYPTDPALPDHTQYPSSLSGLAPTPAPAPAAAAPTASSMTPGQKLASAGRMGPTEGSNSLIIEAKKSAQKFDFDKNEFKIPLTNEEKVAVAVRNEATYNHQYKERFSSAGFEVLSTDDPIVKKILEEERSIPATRGLDSDRIKGGAYEEGSSRAGVGDSGIFVRGKDGIYRIPYQGISSGDMAGMGFSHHPDDYISGSYRNFIAPVTYDLEGNLISFGAVGSSGQSVNVSHGSYPSRLSSGSTPAPASAPAPTPAPPAPTPAPPAPTPAVPAPTPAPPPVAPAASSTAPSSATQQPTPRATPTGSTTGTTANEVPEDSHIPSYLRPEQEEAQRKATAARELAERKARVEQAKKTDIPESDYEGRRTLKSRSIPKKIGMGLVGGVGDLVVGTLAGALIGGTHAAMSYDPEKESDPYLKPFRIIGRATATLGGAVEGGTKGLATAAIAKMTQGVGSLFAGESAGESLTGSFIRGFRSLSGKAAAEEGIGGAAKGVSEGLEDIPYVAFARNKGIEKELRQQARRVKVLESTGTPEAMKKAEEAKKLLESARNRALSPAQRQSLSNNQFGLLLRDAPNIAAYGAGVLTAVPFATLGAAKNLHDTHVSEKFPGLFRKENIGFLDAEFYNSYAPKNMIQDAKAILNGRIGNAPSAALYNIGITTIGATTLFGMATAPFKAGFESSGLAGNANHPFNVIRNAQDPGATARAQMEADAANKVRMTRPNMIGLSDIDEAYFTNQSFRPTRGRHTPGKYNDDGNLVFALSALRRG